jgi:hypothetical protein
MARSHGLLALCLAGCVSLTRPPELSRGEPDASDEDDAGESGNDPRIGLDAAARPEVIVDRPSDGSASDGGSRSDGAATLPADATLPATKLANGASCTDATACQSGYCVDKVCCDTSCASRCYVCDVANRRGTCLPVPAGEDPDNECDQEAAATCGRDGTCDGKGECRRYTAGFECKPGSCVGSTEQAASTCNGSGTCVPGNTRSCSPNLCMGASCASRCAVTTECQKGFFCDGGKCMVTRANGAACGAAEQCSSGFCVDGVCCNSSCGQLCQACNLSGTPGTCTPLPDGQGLSDCPADPPSSCMRAGGCDGRGGCRLHPSGTICGAASCTDGVATLAATCNGGGVCQPAGTRDCGVFACVGAGCAVSCSSNAECKPTYVCNAPSCVPGPKIASLMVNDTARASQWAVESNFQVGMSGAHPWTDYPATYVVSVEPAAQLLLGDEWIRVSANSKNYTGGPQAVLTLSSTADVYMIVDNRWGTTPSFTAGWTDTGWNMVVFESSSRPSLGFSIFVKSAVTGSVSLPPIGSNMSYNYFIIVD